MDSIRAFWDRMSFVVSSKASSGHHSTQVGPSSRSEQRSQILTTFVSGSRVMAPKSQASKHQPQPLQRSSSMRMTPFSSDCVRAFRGHATTQGASSHNRHVSDAFVVGKSEPHGS